MLKEFIATRIGFNNQLMINDIFEIDGQCWIIRHIGNFEVKERIAEGFFGKRGIQKDVIEAQVVAQKKGTFNLVNRASKTLELVKTIPSNSIDIWTIGHIGKLDDTSYFSVKKIHDISFSMTDIKITAEFEQITELPIAESNRLVINQKLNDLGWEILDKK